MSERTVSDVAKLLGGETVDSIRDWHRCGLKLDEQFAGVQGAWRNYSQRDIVTIRVFSTLMTAGLQRGEAVRVANSAVRSYWDAPGAVLVVQRSASGELYWEATTLASDVARLVNSTQLEGPALTTIVVRVHLIAEEIEKRLN